VNFVSGHQIVITVGNIDGTNAKTRCKRSMIIENPLRRRTFPKSTSTRIEYVSANYGTAFQLDDSHFH